jgi:hypothetical protein
MITAILIFIGKVLFTAILMAALAATGSAIYLMLVDDSYGEDR